MEKLKKRKIKVNVKGTIITDFEEYYLVDDNGEEIFNRDLEIENDNRLYEIYRKINESKHNKNN